jgi:branched-chain amino acid transport system ATP-binding protein
LKSIFGVLKPWAGQIKVDGIDLEPSTSEAVRKGLSFSPAGGSNVLRGLSVYENLRIAAEASRMAKGDLDDRLGLAFAAFPVLSKITRTIAGQLSGGQQRMLSVGMALSQKPKILLLDEPSLGLAPVASEQLYSQVYQATTDQRIAVLLVEQNINQALNVCERAYVVRSGRIVAHASSEELSQSDILWGLF